MSDPSSYSSPSPRATSSQNGPDEALAEAAAEVLAALPEAERPAVLDHLRALAELPPDKRQAIVTLTEE